MKNTLNKLIAACLLFGSVASHAEDTDLFVSTPPSTVGDLPNVLIVLDNTANWNTAFTNEMAALKSVLNGLPVNKFNVGLIMYSESGGGNGTPAGGYVRASLRLMDATNKPIYANLFNSFDINNDKGSGRTLALTMAEAYRFYASKNAIAGHNKVKRDYAGNTVASYPKSNAVYALTGNAFANAGSSTYVGPVGTECQKNYIIYIGNTTSTGNVTKDNAADNTTSSNLLKAEASLGLTGVEATDAGNAAIAQIPISPTAHSDNMANEWARFMKKSALNITTYSVDVSQGTSGNGPSNSALLKSMANVSDGKYFRVDSATGAGSQIIDALNSIFSEIQSVNSVFSSVSLPISVNTQGTYLNQLYVGMFRPDTDSFPRWNGNLKQYKLGYINGKLQVVDADSKSSINGKTGFISECARSFWTPTTADSYWAFNPKGSCLTASEDSNTPDGDIVEKGGQGYVLRGSLPASRVVKTCSDASCGSMAPFTSAIATTAKLGAASDAERDQIINWQIGKDIFDENVNANLTEMRPSTHGDVVHSRPVAINYGSITSPDVVIYYGANDGFLRAVNGNQTGVGAGSEMWSFIPPEFYGKIKRRYDNIITNSYPGKTPSIPAAQPKDHGFDGPVTGYKFNSKIHIFATMRRGGNAVYGFDVTDKNAPVLSWKIDPSVAGYSNIGQTWAAPKPIQTQSSGSTPWLAMGGGYDACEDDDPNTGCSSASKGARIYIIDAANGNLKRAFSTERSVIADITVVNDADGNAKYMYTADLGGNIYRISGATANSEIGNTHPSTWTITKIAALGGTGINNRKFMYAPDVIDDNGTFVLLVGSGDREKPLLNYASSITVKNKFFMIKDDPTDAAWLSSENVTCGADVICDNSLVQIGLTGASPTDSTLYDKKGWALELSGTEQVVTSAIVVFNTVTFSTHKPSNGPASGQCSTLGTASVYNIAYTNASASLGDSRGYAISGGGLPPSPVAGKVIIGGKEVPFVIGGDPRSPLQGGDPIPSLLVKRHKNRTYINIKK